MRDAKAPLRHAIDEYLADAPYFMTKPLRPRTVRKYAYAFYRFDVWRQRDRPTFKAWLAGTTAGSLMGDLNGARVRDFVRAYQVAGHAASASTAAIALKVLARYLAQHRVWYGPGFASVLAGIEVPQPGPKGRETLTDDELRVIHRVAALGPNPLLHEAVLYLIRHGLRPDEARVMLLESLVIPIHPSERGSIHVKASKTPSGIREVPLEPRARNFLVRYLHDGRTAFRGCRRSSCLEHPDRPTTPEPLFTTADGEPFHEAGWKSLWRRFTARAKAAGVADFCVYRLRGTRARELKEASWGDSEVIQVLGWSPKNGQRMLRRYIGEYSPKHLKSLPTTFERIA